MRILGFVFIIIGLGDFILSLVGINLTPFLPRQIATVTPILFGLLGGFLIKLANQQEQEGVDSRTEEDLKILEQFKKKTKKSRK